MMDHVQVARALRNLSTNSIDQRDSWFTHLCERWDTLCLDEKGQQILFSTKDNLTHPYGDEKLKSRMDIARFDHPASYQICGIDGSQIYPDRHEQLPYLLINVGLASFTYREKSHVSFSSTPYLYPLEDIAAEIGEMWLSAPIINQLRGERELEMGITHGSLHPESLVLFDGSLLWLHLSAEPHQKKQYLERLCSLFQELYNRRILHGGYVSLPHSRELVQLTTEYGEIAESWPRLFTDSDIMSYHLQPGQRTSFFTPRPETTKAYPGPLCPCFCYLNTGTEIGRLELPAWILADEGKSNTIVTQLLDQCLKGDGYPRCLAEAHEQAVIKESDRIFFNKLVQNHLMSHGKKITLSRKKNAKVERTL
ncbi:MAG: DNA double-strand break repair nuclease NurA [Candidatus Babeliaceae bacterium]|nr:DNA double-strand break repair nuclease NurA [Candidatus Babeliaceae bacterium]